MVAMGTALFPHYRQVVALSICTGLVQMGVVYLLEKWSR